MASITTALTTAIGTAAGEALDAIGGVLPSALLIMGAIVVITIAIRVFKRASN